MLVYSNSRDAIGCFIEILLRQMYPLNLSGVTVEFSLLLNISTVVLLRVLTLVMSKTFFDKVSTIDSMMFQ